MATSISSQGTYDLPSNKKTGNSAKPTFLGKSISIAKKVLLYVAGAVFFPVVSIWLVTREYKNPMVHTNDKCTLITNQIRCFLMPIPIIGGIVHIAGQLLHHFKPYSIFAEEDSIGFISSVLLCTPFVGSGFIVYSLDN